MKKFLVVTVTGLVVWAGTAGAQDETAELAQMLERMRRDVIDLQAYVYNAGELPENLVGTAAFNGSRLHADIQQIQETLRGLAGRIDGLEFGQRQLHEQLSDLEARFVAQTASGNAGEAVDGTGSEGDPGTGESGEVGVLPPGSEMDQYNYAFSLLRKADYEAVDSAFKEFIAVHPKSELIGNAWYWLGSTHFVRERFHDAAVAFLKGYQHDPDGPKAANSLLKLGVTLARLNKIEESCATFRELADKFPDAGEALLGQAIEEAAAAGCT